MIDISKYKKPLLVAGHGIRISGALEEFYELLDRLNIPVVTTFNGFDIVPNDHPNFAGRIGTLGSPEGNKALREADLVIFLGARNNIRQIGYKFNNLPNADKIVIDIDQEEIDKPTFTPDFWKCANVKDFIEGWLREIIWRDMTKEFK